MTIATDLLLDIASEKNGYSIGDPWRFSEFSLAAVVPIQRVDAPDRAYRLLTEVGDDVQIRDTGSIDKVEIANNGSLPVLLKAGEMVAGATQTRTLVCSQVLMAGENVAADCVCVHSTQGIRAGQRVKSGGYSPVSVRRLVYGGYRRAPGLKARASYSYNSSLQQDVWGGVRSYSRGLADSVQCFAAAADSGRLGGLSGIEGEPVTDAARAPWRTSAEDLAGRVREAEKRFEAVIRGVPNFENQVGICLVALSGFESLETFEHPDSWKALRDSVLKSESGRIADVSDQDAVFQFRPEKAKAAIRELLASPFEEAVTVEKADTATFLLETEKLKGEVVTLFGKPIHCTFMRNV